MDENRASLTALFDPATLAADLGKAGLRLREDLSPSEIEDRYFRDGPDGYHAFEHVHFAWAVVDR